MFENFKTPQESPGFSNNGGMTQVRGLRGMKSSQKHTGAFLCFNNLPFFLQPNPVFLPKEFHGQRDLIPGSHKESDITE